MRARVSDDLETSVRAICRRHGRRPDALLEILHELQHEHGYVPKAAVPPIADELNLGRAEVHGVITFYHDFRQEPAGRCVVELCRAEACQAVGADDLAADVEKRLKVKSGETRADGEITLKTVYCFGNCALGPAVTVSGKLYGGGVTAERIESLVKKALKESAS
jgi:formate dehydrogenase subunit gamma